MEINFSTYLPLLNIVCFFAALLGAGAMPNISASDGTTPLMAAVESNNFKVVGWLIERGGASVNSRLSNGGTALHAAARLGYRKICEVLGAYF